MKKDRVPKAFFTRFPTKFVIFAANSTSSDHEIFRTLPQAAPRSDALHGRLPPAGALRHGRRDGARHHLPRQGPHDAAGRRALRRDHGARRRTQAFDVDLRLLLAAEPHQPRPQRFARQPPDLQHPGRRFGEPPERRHVRHHRQTARRGVGIRRQAGDRSAEPRLDPAAGRLPQDPYRRRPPRQGGSAHPARLQLDRQRLHGRPDRPHARKPRRGGLSGHHRRQRSLPRAATSGAASGASASRLPTTTTSRTATCSASSR